MKDLVALFCSPKFHRRVHRYLKKKPFPLFTLRSESVAVLSNGNVSSVVTQSDVVAFAHLCIDAMVEFVRAREEKKKPKRIIEDEEKERRGEGAEAEEKKTKRKEEEGIRSRRGSRREENAKKGWPEDKKEWKEEEKRKKTIWISKTPFPLQADRTIADLNLIRAHVVTARIDDTVTEVWRGKHTAKKKTILSLSLLTFFFFFFGYSFQTLEKLYENRISGLALVDHEFRFRGVFSASDLRVRK